MFSSAGYLEAERDILRSVATDGAIRRTLYNLFRVNVFSMTSAINIRQAQATDSPLIHRFIIELAAYERAESEVSASVEDIENSIFSRDFNTYAIICELNDEPIGFAVYFFNYSTWQGKHGLYLEDLYISSEHRGSGAGKALLQHLAKVAIDKGCGRFEWSVLDWNEPAIGFYDSMGARPKEGWIGYQLTGDALAQFGTG